MFDYLNPIRVHRSKGRNLRDCIIFAYAGSLRGSVEISLKLVLVAFIISSRQQHVITFLLLMNYGWNSNVTGRCRNNCR